MQIKRRKKAKNALFALVQNNVSHNGKIIIIIRIIKIYVRINWVYKLKQGTFVCVVVLS